MYFLTHFLDMKPCSLDLSISESSLKTQSIMDPYIFNRN